MFSKILIITSLLSTLLLSEDTDLDKLSGNWHLRIMDGMEVRKARAILDFDMETMRLSGFDGCNRISGVLKQHSDSNMTTLNLISTRMACRERMHIWVSTRLHETIKEGFGITKAKRNGVDGITLKSQSHELFFKKMGD